METVNSNVLKRFLSYVAVDTQSMEDQKQFPSTEKQFNLARLLTEELLTMGAKNVRMDPYGYVYGEIPSNLDCMVPALGFVSHMDTSPACSGANVKARIVKNYDGGRIMMNQERNISMGPEDFPELSKYVGQDLVITDGTTLLGADDKAGVAEIMTMAACLLEHPEIPHGKICIGFTPDEEVGRGTDLFDIPGFGADVAYTVDGGELGELEYENFNAASAKYIIHGVSIHPGSARGQMKNSLLMGMELHAMLPVFENPACTDGYEGFFHLNRMRGDVENTSLKYIIRDHDREKFEEKKRIAQAAADYMNIKYGKGTVELELKDNYYNMKEKLESHMYLVDMAKEAMEKLGITPLVRPIRGGTDGARLSWKGLPCPNLFTGGHNFHGRFEYIPVQSMEKATELLLELVKQLVKRFS